MVERSEDKLNELIKRYLKKYDCSVQDTSENCWYIKKSPLSGFGVFARRDIHPGEILFLDYPVLLGPRCIPGLLVQCSICFSKLNLTKCRNNCGLHVCLNCSSSVKHIKECQLLNKIKNGSDLSENNELLTKCLTPLRALLLDKEDLRVVASLKSHKGSQHGREVEILTDELKLQLSEEEVNFLCYVCTVLDANAFEVLTDNNASQNTAKGLYPLGSLVNHRCFPNAFYVFDEKYRMVLRSSVFISKNKEIFHSYTKLLWGTITRGFHLKQTKHFVCKCERCKDPSEFGTYLIALKCKKCSGKVLPINLQTLIWQCDSCTSVVPLKEVSNILTLVGSVLKGFSNNDFKLMYTFLTTKLMTLMPDCNQVAVELKFKIIWILGYEQGYLWGELHLELLQTKKQFCKDILEILEKLRRGKCKLKGLLCYELYLCNDEISSRSNTKTLEAESKVYLAEAVDILKYDFSAPQFLKQNIALKK